VSNVRCSRSAVSLLELGAGDRTVTLLPSCRQVIVGHVLLREHDLGLVAIVLQHLQRRRRLARIEIVARLDSPPTRSTSRIVPVDGPPRCIVAVVAST